jgi:hypothetical protein
MAIISLNGVNQLIFVMVKFGVLFEVRTEFLNIIYTSFRFKRLIIPSSHYTAVGVSHRQRRYMKHGISVTPHKTLITCTL